MFYRNQPPYGPMGMGRGMYPGYQQPQGMRKFLAPFLNRGGGAGARSFGGPSSFGASPFTSAFPPTSAAQTAASGGANWLGNLQGALKAVQSAAPMVQQYGPMVKNIPAMINMMKLMNESDEETEEENDNDDQSSESVSEAVSSNHEPEVQKKQQGTSQPKLYI
ncbi:YqfQ family protein [Halobacillus shinanisalinarum]|uniref:YqfQ family protein n=1 Tax=Halobacillus shinanisalinarum TaxID=2932258 RepID=A0ABY4H1J1_9BACI|nr:YqfQ family protein [Halobacillus shinanisalinarum]UOQ93512.1 YqfQ family protein [Halobacillus shinanisalinarum]